MALVYGIATLVTGWGLVQGMDIGLLLPVFLPLSAVRISLSSVCNLLLSAPSYKLLLAPHPSIIRNRRASDTTLAIVFEEGEGDSGALGTVDGIRLIFQSNTMHFFCVKTYSVLYI